MNNMAKYFRPSMVAALALVVTSCSVIAPTADVPTPPVSGWPLERVVGLIHGNCLALRNAVAAGQIAHAIDADVPQRTYPIEIVGESPHIFCDVPKNIVETGEGYVSHEQRGQTIGSHRGDLRYYEIKYASPEDGEDIGLRIGVVAANLEFESKDGLLSTDITNDGANEYFGICTSDEGIHSAVWTKTAESTRVLWHDYYYLSYEVEANCDVSEWQEIVYQEDPY